jgi:hypothetical protein
MLPEPVLVHDVVDEAMVLRQAPGRRRRFGHDLSRSVPRVARSENDNHVQSQTFGGRRGTSGTRLRGRARRHNRGVEDTFTTGPQSPTDQPDDIDAARAALVEARARAAEQRLAAQRLLDEARAVEERLAAQSEIAEAPPSETEAVEHLTSLDDFVIELATERDAAAAALSRAEALRDEARHALERADAGLAECLLRAENVRRAEDVARAEGERAARELAHIRAQHDGSDTRDRPRPPIATPSETFDTLHENMRRALELSEPSGNVPRIATALGFALVLAVVVFVIVLVLWRPSANSNTASLGAAVHHSEPAHRGLRSRTGT